MLEMPCTSTLNIEYEICWRGSCGRHALCPKYWHAPPPHQPRRVIVNNHPPPSFTHQLLRLVFNHCAIDRGEREGGRMTCIHTSPLTKH